MKYTRVEQPDNWKGRTLLIFIKMCFWYELSELTSGERFSAPLSSHVIKEATSSPVSLILILSFQHIFHPNSE